MSDYLTISLFGPARKEISADALLTQLAVDSNRRMQQYAEQAQRQQTRLRDLTDTVSVADKAKSISTNKLSQFLGDRTLYDSSDDTLRQGVSHEVSQLIKLDKGLRRVQALADFIANDDLGKANRRELEKTLQAYMTELQTFAGSLSFSNISVSLEQKSDSVTGKTGVFASPSVLYRQGLVEDIDDPITDLRSGDGLSIKVTSLDADGNETGVKTVEVPLGDLGGEPTLADIAARINAALEAEGVESRARAERLDDDTYGLGFIEASDEDTGSEVIDLSALATSIAPAVRLIHDAGSGLSLTQIDSRGGEAVLQERSSLAAAGLNSVVTTAIDESGDLHVLGESSGQAILARISEDGRVISRNPLGPAGTEGTALAFDNDGNVLISGHAPSEEAASEGFLIKLAPNGEELFRRTIPGASAFSPLDITLTSDGTILVGGSSDGLIRSFDGNGTQQATAEINADRIVSDPTGGFVTATTESGRTILRHYTALGDTADWSHDLGEVQGALAGLTVAADGQIYVAGTTGSPLNGDTGALSGGSDGFVARIDPTNPGSYAAIRYFGGEEDDGISDFALVDGTPYIAGRAGAAVFSAELDSSLGTIWEDRLAASSDEAFTPKLAVSATGSDTLTRLNLQAGVLVGGRSVPEMTLTAGSALRPGDSFSLTLSGGSMSFAGTREIDLTIEADDNRSSFLDRLNKALRGYGSAYWGSADDGRHLELKAENGTTIRLEAGPDGADALRGLGLKPGPIEATPLDYDKEGQAKYQSHFGLGIAGDFTVVDDQGVAELSRTMAGAIRIVADAYRYHRDGPPKEEEQRENQNTKPLTTSMQVHYSEKIRAYQKALAKLGG